MREGIPLSKLQQDFTQGNIAEHLVKFSLPFLLSNLLQARYSVADMLIVGMFCSTTATPHSISVS